MHVSDSWCLFGNYFATYCCVLFTVICMLNTNVTLKVQIYTNELCSLWLEMRTCIYLFSKKSQHVLLKYYFEPFLIFFLILEDLILNNRIRHC